jgi:2-C-methyl-D-erythritol 4-phosphate cytidylyltransferase
MIEGKTSKPVNRKDFYSVQTPQVFFCKEIKKAYDQDYRLHFTDDATVFEAAGGEPRLIYGEEQNIKITMPIDLCLAESLVNKTMEVKLKVMQRSRIH